MEVSSHGLDQQRVAGIDFNVAILTNLSRDHLDYHGTIEAYKAAKKRLFSEHAQAAMILNADDAFGCELYEAFTDPANVNTAHNIWLYGLEKRALTKNALSSARLYAIAEGVKTRHDGMVFMLNSSHGMAQVRVQLMGEFNIYNVLACFCTLIQSGINFNHAIKYIGNLHTVPGRMELLHEPGKPSVVIDYAHTPQALSQALENARKHVSGKLICVFGCGGDRDRGKRPLMAQGAERLADVLIVTSDNPRNEDPQDIINDIKAGIGDEAHLLIETDRRKAILQAIAMADEKDLVLIAGKGHENYQLIGNEKINFNDRLVAEHGLLSYGGQHPPRHLPGKQ